jgi:hypothetical protein
MNSFFRIAIASLLCLLLPLQAGAAVARSTAMSAQHATQAGAKPLQLAHAIGVPHQHGAHSHHENLPNKKAGKPVKSRSVQQAKADCHEAAKCCLAAASAPPSANNQCFDPAIARVAYIPHSLPAVAFLTGGPERPPRFLNA